MKTLTSPDVDSASMGRTESKHPGESLTADARAILEVDLPNANQPSG